MAEVAFNRDPPPGFQGFREDLPIRFYRRRLPHWRQQGATYFVTFRLSDSLPQERIKELDAIKDQWLRQHAPPRTKADWEDLARTSMRFAEGWLDKGAGECWLRRSDCSQIVCESLRHFDSERYELGAFVVMPNHVHAIIRPFDDDEHALEKVLQSIKGFTSRRINPIVGRTGKLWQDESFDRIIRDAEHLWKCLQYVGNNPGFANLNPFSTPTWVQPTWEVLGWRFERRERKEYLFRGARPKFGGLGSPPHIFQHRA